MKMIKTLLILSILLFSLSAYAERIVSLSPGITEILYAIGAGDDVVGVTEFCDYPEDAKSKPKVGSGFRPSIERIVSLHPTIVFGSVEGGEKSLKKTLDNLKIKNQFYKSKTTGDIIESIKSISAHLNIDSSEMADGLSELFNNKYEKIGTGLFLVGIQPFSAAAGGTFVNDIMDCAGVNNIIADIFDGYTIVNYELILSAKPDYIFISGSMGETGLQSFIDRLRSSGVNSKIFRLDCNCFMRPSYRVKEACLIMRRIVTK